MKQIVRYIDARHVFKPPQPVTSWSDRLWLFEICTYLVLISFAVLGVLWAWVWGRTQGWWA